MLSAIEVVDSRIADWRFQLVDTVADNASAVRAVIGTRITPVAALDLRPDRRVVPRNGVHIDSGAGAAILNNPARCVAWLANARLARRLPQAVDIVLPSALHRTVPVRPGDFVDATFANWARSPRFGGANP